MEFLKKRGLVCLVFLLEVLFLAGCMESVAGRERYEQQLQGESIVGEAHAIALGRGSYEISVQYQIEEAEVYCQAVRDTAYGTVAGEQILLPEQLSEKTFEVRLREPADRFFLQVWRAGADGAEAWDACVLQVTIRETAQMDMARNTMLLFIFILADAVWLFWRRGGWERLATQQKSVVCGLLGIWIVASLPLFVNYMITGDDFVFHMMRIEGIAEGLRTGQFPVKMQPGWLNDYGYPVSVMYGDLLLYVPALLRLAGFTLQTAYKCYIFAINGITVAAAYCCVKEFTGSAKSGLLGSLLYTLSAYRLLNIYFRCAVGEYTAMAFFPLVFAGLHMVLHTQEKRKGQLWLIVAYTCILQSHLLSCEMVLLFSGFYCLLQGKCFWRRLWALAGAAGASLLLNLGFLVPFFSYMKTQDLWIKGASSNRMQENGVFVSQLFQTFSYGGAGSASVAQGMAGDMPLGLGLVFCLMFAAFLWQMAVHGGRIRTEIGRERQKEQYSICFMLLLAAWMSCYFFPWESVQKIPLVGNALTVYQFAWRFLAIAVMMGSILGGIVWENFCKLWTKEQANALLLAVGLLALVSGIWLLDTRMASAEARYTTSMAGADCVHAVSGGEYLLQGAQIEDTFDTRVQAGEDVVITACRRNGMRFWITCENQGETERFVQVPVFAYLGYRAYDTAGGDELMVSFAENRILRVHVPAGYAGEILVGFKEPLSWRIAELISVVCGVGLMLYGGGFGKNFQRKYFLRNRSHVV